MQRAYFFGCWNEAGHYMHVPGGGSPQRGTVPEDWRWKFDGTFAPRRARHTGALCWVRQTGERDDRIEHRSNEYPQGRYLIHQVDGFTIMSWWDRTQGDRRGACNSTFLLEGEHDAVVMATALEQHFPHVVENLRKAGVELVEVKKEATTP